VVFWTRAWTRVDAREGVDAGDGASAASGGGFSRARVEDAGRVVERRGVADAGRND